MRTRHNDTPLDPDTDGPVRSCVLTRDRAERDTLIRLALAPDGAVLPDVRAKAPGRGAWIGVTRAELETAIAKGRLRGALARAFKTGDLAIPDDLPSRIEAALQRHVLDRFGLEARAGTLVTGSERIDAAARAGQVHQLYHVADAREDGIRRLAQSWRVGSDQEGTSRQGLVLPLPRPILSMALGRENVVHVAVIDRAAAMRLGEALTRWLHFVGSDPNCQPCGTAPQGASAPGAFGHEPAVDVFEEFE